MDGLETGVEVAADVDLVHNLTVECPVDRIGIVFQVEPVAVTAPELILDFLLGSIDPGHQCKAGNSDIRASPFYRLFVQDPQFWTG